MSLQKTETFSKDAAMQYHYKDFTIIVERGRETDRAFWTDGDMSESRRFSGYTRRELLDIVKEEINQSKGVNHAQLV
jgi:hypothetical protein